jgi:hypothetical protein
MISQQYSYMKEKIKRDDSGNELFPEKNAIVLTLVKPTSGE